MEVNVTGCLHLKTACTYIANNTLLVNPEWFDVPGLQGRFDLLQVEREEPFAANVLFLPPANALLVSASTPRTVSRLAEASDLRVLTVDVSELEKAEAGLTCCSILFYD
jgi:dimethylargininase